MSPNGGGNQGGQSRKWGQDLPSAGCELASSVGGRSATCPHLEGVSKWAGLGGVEDDLLWAEPGAWPDP